MFKCYLMMSANITVACFSTAISSVSEALRIAEDLQLQTDIKGARDRLQQLDRLRMERGEGGRGPHDLDERRVARYQGFEEPGLEVLERFLEQLTRRVQTCRPY